MKKMLIAAAAAALLCGCGGDRYLLRGEIEGIGRTVYLFDDQNNLLDSASVERGAFRFEGRAAQPRMALLRNGRTAAAPLHVLLFLEPGTITVTDGAEDLDVRVTGTPANDARTAHAAAASALVAEYRDAATTEERREAIDAEYEGLTRKTVEENRDNLFGALLLAEQLSYELSGRELLDQIDRFAEPIRSSAILTGLRATAEKRMKTDIGQPYIDIVQPDPSGREVSLRSVVERPGNEYVLLDFWASWCGPCMGEVPHLKKTYADFRKRGFEIYGLSLDKSSDRWLAAIREHGMDWIHVSDLSAFDNPAAAEYGVQSIPTNFLIDRRGRIVARNLRGEELYRKVAELLGEAR